LKKIKLKIDELNSIPVCNPYPVNVLLIIPLTSDQKNAIKIRIGENDAQFVRIRR
jgi:hypothetical protein